MKMRAHKNITANLSRKEIGAKKCEHAFKRPGATL